MRPAPSCTARPGTSWNGSAWPAWMSCRNSHPSCPTRSRIPTAPRKASRVPAVPRTLRLPRTRRVPGTRAMSTRAGDGSERPGGGPGGGGGRRGGGGGGGGGRRPGGGGGGGGGGRAGAGGGKPGYGRDVPADPGHDSLIDVPGGVRLQKVLAAAGVDSRRHCEELIGE